MFSVTSAASTGLNTYEVALYNLKLKFIAKKKKKRVQKSDPVIN